MTTITITQAIQAMELTIKSLRESNESLEREISSEFLLKTILSCDIQVTEVEKTSDDEVAEEEVKIPKKRGRPPKKVTEVEKTSDDEVAEEEVKIPKKRGRPPKKVTEVEKTSDDEVVEEEKTSDEECGYCPGCEAGTDTKHSYDNNCYYSLHDKI